MTVPIESAPRNHVLVVDDELSVRELLADALDAYGYTIRTAASAAEGYRIVEEGDTHLILSDIDMPGESGLDLLRRIKAHDADIDVIMVTGVVDVDTAIGAIREGAADYVAKPFNIEEVRIVVERTVRNRLLVLENRAYQLHLEEMVRQRTRELEESYEATLQALVTALDYRDNETQGHSFRVVEYAEQVARRVGVGEADLAWIRRGAILHDVGKIGVPDAILRKPGKLDPDEWVEMRRHPEMGYRMLRHIGYFTPALDIVLSHQERWDGSGYPRGLKGEEIPLGARIFAVVDTFDAMTSDRPYRRALSVDAAREEVRRFAGIQFDPRVAAAFLSIGDEIWAEIRARVRRDLDATVSRLRDEGA
ncbi:MAG: response regulator [Acidobacteriia bacterium]|nr:response regulator [Terriglobia bacterium]